MRAVLAIAAVVLAAAVVVTGLSSAAGARHPIPASGAPQVVGPYACDYTQIRNAGDTLTLFDPSPGLVVLAAWPNPRTLTPFQADGSEYIEVGQASELPDAYWAIVDDDLAWDNIKGSGGGSSSGRNYPAAVPADNISVHVAPVHTLDEPVVCEYHSSDGADGPPLTAGHADWYFEVATPAAP